MYRFLVEVIYREPFMENSGTEEARWSERMASTTFQFSDEKESIARHEATKHMDTILRYGLKLAGGAVVKSVITPANICQVGVVDYQLYRKEVESGIGVVA